MSFAPPPSSLCHPLHLLRLSSNSSSLMYHPSKAQQIMSRYRRIAPKPAPPDRPAAAPPHDSLASSITTTTSAAAAAAPPPKHRRSRKRRPSAAHASPHPSPATTSSSPLPKIARRHADSSASLLAAVPAISAAISNTGGASSLTQGNSDAAVPLRPVDLMWASPGASSSAADDSLEVSNTRIATSVERQSSLEQQQQQQQTYSSDFRWSGGGAPVPAAAAHGHAYGSPAASMFLAIPSPKLIPPPPPQPPPHHHFPHSPANRLGGAFLTCPVSDMAPPVLLPKDIAFIDRGVAGTVAVPVPDRSPPPPAPSVQNVKGVSGSHGGAGGFTEMIRGIMRLPTAADVQSLMQVRAGSGAPAASVSLQEAAFCNIPRSSVLQQGREMEGGPGAVQIVPQYASLGGARRTPAVGKPEMDEDRNRLVTLNLLPDVPSKSAAAAEAPEVVPIEFLATDASRWRAAAASDMSSSSTKTMYGIPGGGGLQVSGSPPSSLYAAATIPEGVDRTHLLEQIHGASADPVVLLDERDRVIWCNRAYERALKSASERSVGGSTSGPYIDPLGHPTPLGSVELPSAAAGMGGKAGATLWGFLKKLVIQEPARGAGRAAGNESLENRLLEGNRVEAAAAAAMVVGEPPRLTTVTLEKVMEVDTEGEAVVGEVEKVEALLAAGREPAFITDGRNRVRWMNTAFTRMVGGGEGGGGPPEMTFLCCAERMPRAASAFSGCVNLEWANAGKRRSMMVPCDVKKMVVEEAAEGGEAAAEGGGGGGGRTDGCRKNMWWWVWRFDVAVSLSLHSSPAF